MDSQPRKFRLKQDITSGKFVKSVQQLYGKKNTVVTLVATHDNVLIVEDKNGNRFPVHSDKVTPI